MLNAVLQGTPACGAGADAGVDEALVPGLRMLRRGPAQSSLPSLSTVSMVGRLPRDESGEAALRQVCAHLTAERVRSRRCARRTVPGRPVAPARADELVATGPERAEAGRFGALPPRFSGMRDGLRPASSARARTGRWREPGW